MTVLCACGCGDPAPVRRGVRLPYRQGHHMRRASGPRWQASDAGYSTPCWIWTGMRNSKGYGVVWDPDRQQNRHAHRVLWERENGPVPDGLELDHLCHVRPCVRLDHLEVVTHKENMRRGYAITQRVGEGVAGEIKRARLAAGLSQADLAKRLECSQSLVGLWETAKTLPPAWRLQQIREESGA